MIFGMSRAFGPEPTRPQAEQAGFVPAMIVAETAPTVPAAPANGRLVIIVGKDRRVIVDAAVDATALARVLQVLEGHQFTVSRRNARASPTPC